MGAIVGKEPGFSSVWGAIEGAPQQAASMRARSALMIELETIIKQRGMTQATVAGLEPHVTLRKPKASRKRRDAELAVA